MTDADWVRAFLAVLGVLMVGWVTWVSRGVANALSRKDHAEICEAREHRIERSLDEIKTLISGNEERASRTRHRMNNRIQEIALGLVARGYNLPKVSESDEEGG